MAISTGEIVLILVLIVILAYAIWWFIVVYKYGQTVKSASYARGANLDTRGDLTKTVTLQCDATREICVEQANLICTGSISSQSNTEDGPEPISNGAAGNSAYGMFDLHNTINVTKDIASKANGLQSYTLQANSLSGIEGICPSTNPYNKTNGSGIRPQLIATYVCVPKGTGCKNGPSRTCKNSNDPNSCNLDQDCNGRGTCQHINGICTCLCNAGYTGAHCQNKIPTPTPAYFKITKPSTTTIVDAAINNNMQMVVSDNNGNIWGTNNFNTGTSPSNPSWYPISGTFDQSTPSISLGSTEICGLNEGVLYCAYPLSLTKSWSPSWNAGGLNTQAIASQVLSTKNFIGAYYPSSGSFQWGYANLPTQSVTTITLFKNPTNNTVVAINNYNVNGVGYKGNLCVIDDSNGLWFMDNFTSNTPQQLTPVQTLPWLGPYSLSLNDKNQICIALPSGVTYVANDYHSPNWINITQNTPVLFNNVSLSNNGVVCGSGNDGNIWCISR